MAPLKPIRSVRASIPPLSFALALALAAAPPSAAAAAGTEPRTKPAGQEKAPKTKVLEAGAKALQGKGPVGQLNMYLVGFHPMKENVSHSMEAHHFCRQVNQDFAQCALFDGDSEDANLNGIEYIISEKLFETLPPEERKYWHPHNYEILSGQLVMPGLPDVAEKEALAGKMNSYGKTWHLWNTGVEGKPGDKLPVGVPMLAWSYNADGEIKPAMTKSLENRLGISLMDKRKQRAELVKLAKPQEGVDALEAGFPGRTPIPGVSDKQAAGGKETGSGKPAGGPQTAPAQPKSGSH